MEFNTRDCVGCGATFQVEKKRGRPHTKCNVCRVKVDEVLQFALMTRKEEVTDGVTMVESTEPCKDCGNIFMRPKKRGKPPTRCPGCRDKFDLAKAEVVGTSDDELEALFQGDKILLKGTPGERPKGAEAQCPSRGKCGRIFTSNTACDDHKRWLPTGSYDCIDPATLGMEPRSRKRDDGRIVPVWTRPTLDKGA